MPPKQNVDVKKISMWLVGVVVSIGLVVWQDHTATVNAEAQEAVKHEKEQDAKLIAVEKQLAIQGEAIQATTVSFQKFLETHAAADAKREQAFFELLKQRLTVSER